MHVLPTVGTEGATQVEVPAFHVYPAVSHKQPAGDAAPPAPEVEVPAGHISDATQVELPPSQLSPALLHKHPAGSAAPPAPVVEVPVGQVGAVTITSSGTGAHSIDSKPKPTKY